jgi:asparagine synthase (glutamine-hydrolysing)
MCGIVGYWSPILDPEGLRNALPAASASLRHRGPDGEGLWFGGNGVGFGHRRLAILDLSEAGAQPMISLQGELVIVFNGEIYNFREIAAELSSKGHTFVGHSDTEVILAAYREWGPSCIDRFIGMFAFAIWDGARRRLSLCRDRVGVKPLYYGWDGQVLCFASELKALRALSPWPMEIDRVALGEFLQYGYISAPRSIYRRVHKLPPGCWLHVEHDKEPAISPYWTLSDVLAHGKLTGKASALESELEALLESAFRYRLVSDVPVGLFLSGGVDSSLVAGILRSSGVRLETFTIGFKSKRYDESAAAAGVAAALGLHNHALIVDEKEAESLLALWPDLYDEPFGDHSGIPTYLVARMARERVAVALSADGGDELFCGYSGYQEMAERLVARDRIPAWMGAIGVGSLDLAGAVGATSLAGRLGPKLHRRLGNGLLIDRLNKARGFLGAPAGVDVLRPFRSFWQPREVAVLLGETYRDPRDMSRGLRGLPMEQIAAMDFHEYLPDNVLAKVDRATMAVSLEGREPLLDHRIIEFAFRLPLELRHGPLGNKHILRSILYRHVPRELVERPKQGFAVPISKWMERFLSTGAVQERISVLKQRIGLDAAALDGALHAYAGSDVGKNRLWLLYVLGRWAERWGDS